MKPTPHIAAAAAARFYTPLMLLFAATLYTASPGAGWSAGLAASMAILLHALVFGGRAASVAFPPWAARLTIVAGAAAAFVGDVGRSAAWGRTLAEAGLFCVVAAGASLITLALFGRAQMLRQPG